MKTPATPGSLHRALARRTRAADGSPRGGDLSILLAGWLAAPSRTSPRCPPGARLLACTDGLVERRGEDIDRGLARLLDAAAGSTGLGPSERVDLLFDGLGRSAADDVTLAGLAYRAVGDIS